MFLCPAQIQWIKPWMNHRPFAIGAAGGSFASFALKILQNSIENDFSRVPESISDCLCPQNFSEPFSGLDSKSLLVGICIGLALWPILELVLVVRHWWCTIIRRQLLALSRTTSQLYRDI